MAVLDPERSSAKRSALRYRPIAMDQAVPAPAISRTRRSRPDVRMTAAIAAPDDLDLEEERVPHRRSKTLAPQARTRRRAHPLLFVGLGLLLTMLLWAGITQAVNWGTNQYNNIVYGSPRTFQTDAIVGHGDSRAHPSHFVEVKWDHFLDFLFFYSRTPAQITVN